MGSDGVFDQEHDEKLLYQDALWQSTAEDLQRPNLSFTLNS